MNFHGKVLFIEELLKEKGIKRLWGMIGGACGLCVVCKARDGQPCPYPDRARTSLEALAIDVPKFLATFGLDNRFHEDRITWTGCVLF
jgi:predicted metal-binding protein